MFNSTFLLPSHEKFTRPSSGLILLGNQSRGAEEPGYYHLTVINRIHAGLAV